MGQKANPIGLRVGLWQRKWNHTWYSISNLYKKTFFAHYFVEKFFQNFFKYYNYTKKSQSEKALVVNTRILKPKFNFGYLFIFFYKLRTTIKKKKKKKKAKYLWNLKSKKVPVKNSSLLNNLNLDIKQLNNLRYRSFKASKQEACTKNNKIRANISETNKNNKKQMYSNINKHQAFEATYVPVNPTTSVDINEDRNYVTSWNNRNITKNTLDRSNWKMPNYRTNYRTNYSNNITMNRNQNNKNNIMHILATTNNTNTTPFTKPGKSNNMNTTVSNKPGKQNNMNTREANKNTLDHQYHFMDFSSKHIAWLCKKKLLLWWKKPIPLFRNKQKVLKLTKQVLKKNIWKSYRYNKKFNKLQNQLSIANKQKLLCFYKLSNNAKKKELLDELGLDEVTNKKDKEELEEPLELELDAVTNKKDNEELEEPLELEQDELANKKDKEELEESLEELLEELELNDTLTKEEKEKLRKEILNKKEPKKKPEKRKFFIKSTQLSLVQNIAYNTIFKTMQSNSKLLLNDNLQQWNFQTNSNTTMFAATPTLFFLIKKQYLNIQYIYTHVQIFLQFKLLLKCLFEYNTVAILNKTTFLNRIADVNKKILARKQVHSMGIEVNLPNTVTYISFIKTILFIFLKRTLVMPSIYYIRPSFLFFDITFLFINLNNAVIKINKTEITVKKRIAYSHMQSLLLKRKVGNISNLILHYLENKSAYKYTKDKILNNILSRINKKQYLPKKYNYILHLLEENLENASTPANNNNQKTIVAQKILHALWKRKSVFLKQIKRFMGYSYRFSKFNFNRWILNRTFTKYIRKHQGVKKRVNAQNVKTLVKKDSILSNKNNKPNVIVSKKVVKRKKEYNKFVLKFLLKYKTIKRFIIRLFIKRKRIQKVNIVRKRQQKTSLFKRKQFFFIRKQLVLKTKKTLKKIPLMQEIIRKRVRIAEKLAIKKWKQKKQWKKFKYNKYKKNKKKKKWKKVKSNVLTLQKLKVVFNKRYFDYKKNKDLISLFFGHPIALYYINALAITRFEYQYNIKLNKKNILLNRKKSSKRFIQRLEKQFIRRYKFIANYLPDFTRIGLLSLYTRNYAFLMRYFAFQIERLQKNRKETRLIQFIIKALKIFSAQRREILALKIQFKGRVNRWRRTKIITGKRGYISFYTYKTNLEYATATAVTRKGALGIRFWLSYTLIFKQAFEQSLLQYLYYTQIKEKKQHKKQYFIKKLT